MLGVGIFVVYPGIVIVIFFADCLLPFPTSIQSISIPVGALEPFGFIVVLLLCY